MLLKIEQLPIEVQTPLILESDVIAAIEAAVGAGDAPPMALPEPMQAENRWTPEKIIELCIVHLGGDLSSDRVYEELKESGIPRAQVRRLLETVYSMEPIIFNGQEYTIKRIKKTRYLVPVNAHETEEAA